MCNFFNPYSTIVDVFLPESFKVVNELQIHIHFADVPDKMIIQLKLHHQAPPSIPFLGNYWHSDISEVQMQLLSYVRF